MKGEKSIRLTHAVRYKFQDWTKLLNDQLKCFCFRNQNFVHMNFKLS